MTDETSDSVDAEIDALRARVAELAKEREEAMASVNNWRWECLTGRGQLAAARARIEELEGALKALRTSESCWTGCVDFPGWAGQHEPECDAARRALSTGKAGRNE